MADDLVFVVRIPCVPLLHPATQEILDSQRNIRFISSDEVSDKNRSRVQGLYIHAGFVVVDSALMDCYPELRVISSAGVGVDHIDLAAATIRGIRVGNTPGVVQECTADHAIGLLLASARKICSGDSVIRQPGFSKESIFNSFGTKVTGSTLGIVGLGGVGSAVANRAKGFKMRILYHNRTRKEDKELETGAEYCSKLDELLKESDFVVLCCALTDETRHLITAAQLSQMKSSATLINVARGGLVNHDDLTTALQNGVIRGAALDVTEPEPLPHGHPLLALPNVIVTPHVGATTFGTFIEMMQMVMDNLAAGISNKTLPYQVN
ncbi:glyoxylate/hydroxypyruvate reductase B [Nematostella vectensis]|uniref:glyoxylate/hydroxypyruvate reductase B n=1 Tax=Nematostella vectensis TaxID=45351 RepID=UPI00138FA494|nr:glyoxylate/hydroxypyruvate reductase B [Nematostella vectensis]